MRSENGSNDGTVGTVDEAEVDSGGAVGTAGIDQINKGRTVGAADDDGSVVGVAVTIGINDDSTG